MSDADEKKSEDLSFDVNDSVPLMETDDSFDFGAFTDAPVSLSEEPSDSAFGGFGETPPEVSAPSEPEFPEAPSSFLAGNFGEETAESEILETEATESETVVPVVETSGKKGKAKREKKPKEKKQKPAREAGPREPMDIGASLSLGLGSILLLVLIAVNALIFTAPATPGIGGASTIYYAVAVNVFGLVIVAVPFLFWKFRKGKEPQQNLQLFEVCLGIALMSLTIGVLCFLTALFRYDFTIK